MKGDPFWKIARFDDGDIKKGDRVFYFPRTRRALKGEAAEQASRDFEAARADEDNYL